MKIWLTAPFDDSGIVEVNTFEDPTGDCFSYMRHGLYVIDTHWYREGATWHRTKKAALDAAMKFRRARIADAKKEAARVAALPSIRTERADHE